MSKPTINDCRCGNSYLAIRTDLYKDKREFIYCDCCGAMADRETWHRATLPAAAEAPALRDAVFTVLEGFTLPHDVRKILETAYYVQPKADSTDPARLCPSYDEWKADSTAVNDKSHPRFHAGYDAGLHDRQLETESGKRTAAAPEGPRYRTLDHIRNQEELILFAEAWAIENGWTKAASDDAKAADNRKDAKRYRVLREKRHGFEAVKLRKRGKRWGDEGDILTGEALDAAIDAAIAASKGAAS